MEPVNAKDRLSFTLFVAIALHGLVILGINFKMPPKDTGSQTIEITLATHKSLKAPTEADFLAQHNQEASGTEEKARQLTTEKLADFADTQVRDINPTPQMAATAPKEKTEQRTLTTKANAQFQTKLLDTPEPLEEKNKQEGLLENQTATTTEIASLQAKLDKQKQEYAKRPRIRTLTSVSAKESYDAQYLNAWGEKVERIGNNNYPQEALRKHITGSLRLSVTINPDGTIYQIDILQSSGKPILDNAARQIVRQASPFAKFPPEIRMQSDRLQIIRTWNFEITGLNTSAE
jgi:protein TonB